MPLREAAPFEARTAFLLAFLAGGVDAVGFSHLGGVFVSFMSGNTTRFGLHLAAADWTAAASILGIVASFVLGAAAGAVVGGIGPRWRRATLLGSEAAALLLAAALGATNWREGAGTVMAFAMGMENEVFVNAAGETRISLTFVSGTLVKLGESLGHMIAGGPRTAWLRFFALWLSLTAGVVTGGLCYTLIGLWTLAGVAIVLLALAVSFASRDEAVIGAPAGAQD